MTEAERLEMMKERLSNAQHYLREAMRELNLAITHGVLAENEIFPSLIRREYQAILTTEDRIADIRTGRNL